jgi:molybdopterin-guanine dinucleotide biosynthesis protein A
MFAGNTGAHICISERRRRIAVNRNVSSVLTRGVILAGGNGTRSGGVDKAFERLGDRLLVEHVIERLVPRADRIVINSNASVDRFHHLSVPVVPDCDRTIRGPLAGIYSALRRSGFSMM